MPAPDVPSAVFEAATRAFVAAIRDPERDSAYLERAREAAVTAAWNAAWEAALPASRWRVCYRDGYRSAAWPEGQLYTWSEDPPTLQAAELDLGKCTHHHKDAWVEHRRTGATAWKRVD